MDKNLKTVIIGASILAGAVGMYFIGKAIVKKAKKSADKKRGDKLKNEMGVGESTTAEKIEEDKAKKYNPNSDVKSLAAQIVGYNTYCRTSGVDKVIMRLNKPELKILNTAWKKKYKKSLYRYLDDEHDNAWFFENCYPASMRRLSNAGLR
jgi:hypothetical protein